MAKPYSNGITEDRTNPEYKPAKDWIEKHLPKAPQWLEQLVNPNE